MAVSMREQLKQAMQERVLDAASWLFQRNGFEATTVRAIADGAGVSVGSVIAVGDKNALLVRVFDSMVADEHASRSETEVRASDDTDNGCAQRLSVLVRPFVALFTDRPELSRSYASILVSGTHSSSLFTQLAERLTQEFTAAISLHGCTSEAAAPVKARALYAAYVGTLFTWSALGAEDSSELMSTLEASFAAICACKE